MRRTSSTTSVLASLTVGALLSLGQPALAQTAPKPTDTAQRADAQFLEGKQLLKEGKKQAAREKYLAAWRLKKTYDIAGNLGSLELDLGMYREAAEHLSFAVNNYATTGTTAAQLEKAKQRLSEAKKQVGAVTVSVSVEGAEVLVDGVSVGRAPLGDEVYVDPGARVFEARLAGHEGAREMMVAAKGGEGSVRLVLKALPVAVPAPAGSAAVPEKVVPRVGPEGKSWVPVAVLGAASVVGLGLGIGMTVASNGAKADADALRAAIRQDGGRCVEPSNTFVERCGEFESQASQAEDLGNATILTYAASGTLAAAAVVYALWPRKPAASGARAWPTLHVGSSGVSIEGVW
jgi:hypothetical protein